MKCSRQDEKQFRAEISSLGNIQHVNFVRLRRFCAKGSRQLLVYDYMPKGSLNSILFTGSSKSKREGNTMNIVEEGVAEEANMEEMLEGKVEPQTPQVMDRPVDRSDTSSITYSHVTN
ncbi:hypothetical protein SUGI_1392380 [Cryptomeria japonica]|uniref:Serine-threonine/tyrosine-protein kinase catalytic domain-containing protein n=1 Tax=Cryptomeria japonica TaxID=3369 RepID=A0AAD3NSF5_CRYJA|nr:hypothetical protein SUGI_1392340 [Cryptomeria japonica]GLJ57947.1 hypothetical protein SUGI_1392380 [Cryptomeria japonica]